MLIDELTYRYRVIETLRSFDVKFSNQSVGETREEFAAELKVCMIKPIVFEIGKLVKKILCVDS
jgi:hypothetical protein